MKKKTIFAGFISILLVFCFAFLGCGNANTEEAPPDDDPLGTRSAQAPVISLQPISSNYVTGTAIAPLSVSATVSDSGTLTYQWYSNTSFRNSGGQAISGQTGATFTPPATTGDAYYYVVVTNHNESAERGKTTRTASSPARIRVSASAAAEPASSITIDITERHQYVRGFGGMSSAMFRAGNGGASPDIDVKDIDIMFGPGGLGYKMFRIMLCDDLDGVMANQYPGGNGVWQDNSDYYELVKRVNLYGGYVLASPWTAPADFKTNNALVGPSAANLKTDRYIDYANYLRAFCQRMLDNGAPIFAVSIQNEPNANVGYEGMAWSANQMRDWFKLCGPFTQKRVVSGTTVADVQYADDPIPGYGGGQATPYVLTMNGETVSDCSINDAALNDSVSRPYIDLIGRHIYGSQSRYANAIDHATDPKEVWMTEHNVNSQSVATYLNDYSWPYVWKFINEVDLNQRLCDENAFIWWYAKRFYSLVGDGQYGTLEHQILPRGYALSHYAKFATDTTRVGITSVTGISSFNNTTYNQTSTVPKASAYESMDRNSVSLVIYTPTSDSGTGGVNIGDLKINLPWQASSAYAVISDANRKMADEVVVLSADKASAVITLPAGTIISVKFTK